LQNQKMDSLKGKQNKRGKKIVLLIFSKWTHFLVLQVAKNWTHWK
jgi:hypothetical protein